MTEKELEDKFRELTATFLTEEHTENIVGTVAKLEELEDIRKLISFLAIDQTSFSHRELS